MKRLFLMGMAVLVSCATAQEIPPDFSSLKTLALTPPSSEEATIFNLPQGYKPGWTISPVTKGEFFWEDPELIREKFMFTTPWGDKSVGYVFYPVGRTQPLPGVLVLAGSPGKAQTKSLFARDLAKTGMVSVVYDALPSRLSKGFGHSQEEVLKVYTGLIIEYRAVLSYLKNRLEVDPQRVAVVGESMGGVWGSALTGLEPEVKAFVFQISTPAINIRSAFERLAPGEVPLQFRNQNLHQIFPVLKSFVLQDPLRYTLLPRSAPVLWQNKTEDTVFPKEMAEEILGYTLGPKEIQWYPGGHGVTSEMDAVAIKWLVDHL